MICKNVSECPLYTGKLESNPVRIKTYKSFYCENGKSNYEKCRRYQVGQVIEHCPPDILPNCNLTVEEIINRK